MKLSLICETLEPGRCGVGDYTRRLAAECRRQGAEARMLSLYDTGVQELAIEEEQAEGDTCVPCLRLPGAWHQGQRLETVRNWLQAWRPDWASLQFVPFGYQKKGLPWQLGSMLARLPGTPRWHIMFHELWVGAFACAPWKLRLLGMAQRQVIRQLLRQLKPARVHTQARPHQQLLHLLGVQAARLPLFGNIRIQPDDTGEGRRIIFGGLPSEAGAPHAWHIGGLFGVIHPEWQPEPFFSQWLETAEKAGRQPLLVLIGRSGRSAESLERLLQPYLPRLTVRILGPLPDQTLSQVLQAMDFGLATIPWRLREKSSALSTLREHGLPVVLTRDDWRPRGVSESLNVGRVEEGCFLAQADHPILFQALQRQGTSDNLRQIAAQFLSDLQA